MRFLHPQMASWLLLVPLAVCAWYLHVQNKWLFRRRASFDRHLPALSKFSSWRRDTLTFLAGVLAVALLVAALTRPQLYYELRTPEYEKEDLVLLLDRSVSMRAEDIRPSRFSRAVVELRRFLTHKPEFVDRIGLVGFSGTSLMLSPLTRDVDKLIFYLEWIEQDLDPQFGTNIGAALQTARELVRKDTHDTRKVFLIVSDGDDQGEELQRMLSEYRADNFPIYTVGIGGEQPVPIPIPAEDFAQTNNMTELRDENGRIVRTQFSPVTLRNIATLTGGRFVHSTTGQELGPALFEAVNRERKVVGYNSSTEYRELYRFCLAAAGVATFILLIAL
jgi:Ca-activated chloride channel family protein